MTRSVEYYVLLRSLSGARPELRPCLKRCRHCRIFFLTDPRNRGRRDLRCPFGCREAHRRERSTERSTAYNRSAVGKVKKKVYNGRRGGGGRPLEPVAAECPGEDAAQAAEPSQGRLELDRAVVEHLRVVVSLIEERPVSRDEVLEMLRGAVRQRSFARERRIDYVVRVLKD